VIGYYGASTCYSSSNGCAWFNGWSAPSTDIVYQAVTIPSNITTATLSFYLKITTAQPSSSPAKDFFYAQIRSSANCSVTVCGYNILDAPLATYSNANAWSLPFSYGSYVRLQFDVTKFKGQTIAVYFYGTQSTSTNTNFLLDNVYLTVQ
jgi:hypothetical protein